MTTNCAIIVPAITIDLYDLMTRLGCTLTVQENGKGRWTTRTNPVLLSYQFDYDCASWEPLICSGWDPDHALIELAAALTDQKIKVKRGKRLFWRSYEVCDLLNVRVQHTLQEPATHTLPKGVQR